MGGLGLEGFDQRTVSIGAVGAGREGAGLEGVVGLGRVPVLVVLVRRGGVQAIQTEASKI